MSAVRTSHSLLEMRPKYRALRNLPNAAVRTSSRFPSSAMLNLEVVR